MATDTKTVISKLITIVENGFGADISNSNKERLNLIGTVLGGLAEEAAPYLEQKFDLSELLSAVEEGEDAIVSGEESARKLIAIFNKNSSDKKTEETKKENASSEEEHSSTDTSATTPVSTNTQETHNSSPF